MQYTHLNRYDIAPDDERYTDAWRRVLARLGDYTAIIVKALNMRPTGVALLAQTKQHVLVRISTPVEHVVLRIAPDADLAGEVYFGRTATAHNLPAARIIQHDLSSELVPFTYTLESYVSGCMAAQIESDHLLRPAARQVGRVLRRMHRVEARGWGRPNAAGRWTTPDWHTILTQLHATYAAPPADELVFDTSERSVIAAILAHPLLACTTPRLMHGDIRPEAARCVIGGNVHLEALVDPGSVIGGDGLLDLAFGLNPTHPETWVAGLLEGYAGAMPLSAEEQQRLRLLRALTCFWSACWAYMRAEPHEAAHTHAQALLAAIQSEEHVMSNHDKGVRNE